MKIKMSNVEKIILCLLGITNVCILFLGVFRFIDYKYVPYWALYSFTSLPMAYLAIVMKHYIKYKNEEKQIIKIKLKKKSALPLYTNELLKNLRNNFNTSFILTLSTFSDAFI